MHDLLIKGGKIVDGSGSEAFMGDLAIDAGKIAAIGKINGSAKRTINADGQLVTPGWVDMH
ncbi:MAG: D-aminoacylase, partial [Candidatus Poribacteria bacterium]|nr:D-aminoacylase [Candidatus Poribacteria bacterium]